MPEQVKIAVDIRDLRIARTGARTYLEELISEFKKLESDTIQFYFYDTGIPVYTGRNSILKLIEHIRFFIWKQIQLPLKAASDGCDIIFCTDYFVPYIHLGYKTISVFHDAFFFEYPGHYNKLWLLLFKSIGIGAANRSFAIVTPTRYTKERISELAGISRDKIRVVYEGPKSLCTSETEISSDPEAIPEKYLLHVGTMEKRKNIVRLLKAFKLLLNNHPSMKLVLTGQFSPKKDMDDREEIMKYIAKNDLSKNIIFTGYVSDTELDSYYKNAMAYVFPSLNEGFGIPILEAFQAGIPVLVAGNSCLPEVGGGAVEIFDPYDPIDIFNKIERVLSDNERRDQMVRMGMERLEQFSWENAAKELVRLFREASGKRGSD